MDSSRFSRPTGYSVLGHELSIPYTSEMCDQVILVKNRLFDYADNCILLAVIREPFVRYDVTTTVNRDVVQFMSGAVV